MARAAVELEVGARPKGQASFATPTSMTTFASTGQRGGEVSREGDAGHADVADAVHDHVEFGRLPAVRDGQKDIVLRDDAQIAVQTFHGVEEEGLRAGAGQGGHDLSADQARFTDPGDDHPSLGTVDQIDCAEKRLAHLVDEVEDAFRLDSQHFLRLGYRTVFCHLHEPLLIIPLRRCCRKMKLSFAWERYQKSADPDKT